MGSHLSLFWKGDGEIMDLLGLGTLVAGYSPVRSERGTICQESCQENYPR